MKRAWPPYHMMEESIAGEAQRKLDKLERLYHIGQNNIWDGKQVLAELIARHGQPKLPPEQRDAALKLLSILLWGELAAWAISADLAERIDDVEAKMAATSQAHDEARHFYVLRDYLRVGELPPFPRVEANTSVPSGAYMGSRLWSRIPFADCPFPFVTFVHLCAASSVTS